MASWSLKVAVLAFDGISQFHLSVPLLVFGLDGVSGMKSRYEVTVCAEHPGTVRTASGIDIRVPSGLGALRRADVIVIPSWDDQQDTSPRLLTALRRAHDRGTTLVGLCLGSWLVAASGVADGRAVATHWSAAPALAARFPDVEVRDGVLWCDEGSVVTSAGVAAAIDGCRHVGRRQIGSEYAAAVARAIVLAPHRSGSQAQYIQAPVAPYDGDDPGSLAMTWAARHLHEEITVDRWAAIAAMSRRHFSRRFVEHVGESPMRWLRTQRIDRARQLLETTVDPIPVVASLSGFHSPEALRHHFRSTFGISPSQHRAGFSLR